MCDVISLDQRRKLEATRKTAEKLKAKLQDGQAVVSTTVVAYGEQVHIAFSQSIHSLRLHKKEAEQLALIILAAAQGPDDERKV